MPKYEAKLDLPMFGDNTDLEKFIEGLRQHGYPTLTVEIEAKDRDEAAAILAESTESFGTYYGSGSKFSSGYWLDRLRAMRGKRLTESAKMIEDRDPS